MSRIIDPVILFQYKTSPRLSTLLEGLRQFVIDNSKEDLEEFLDIDKATGLWLDQIGAYLNILRPLITISTENGLAQEQNGSALTFQNGEPFLYQLTPDPAEAGTFVMDFSLMDGADLLDGTNLSSDALYKNYIKGQIYRRNSRFSINDIISVLQFTIASSSIFIVEGVKTLTIYAAVPDNQTKINVDLLNSLNPKWFGLPTGVRLAGFNTYILPATSTFLITDFNEMDNPNIVMV